MNTNTYTHTAQVTHELHASKEMLLWLSSYEA